MANELIAPTRDQWRDKYLRAHKLRSPNSSVAQDEQPWIDASALADCLVIQSENAKRMARGMLLSEATGNKLDQRGAERDIPRAEATGASGQISIETSLTGTDLFSGDELVHEETGLKYECTAGGHYTNGVSVPVRAVSSINTGGQTNLAAGAVLIWSAPRPGCFPKATVVMQPDGSGLSGGREREDDDTYRSRLYAAQADPAASGNDSEYQLATEKTTAHGVAVQKAFTYPGLYSSGSTGVAFTLTPAKSGGSRRPNSTQISLVEAYVTGQMPGDDGPVFLLVLAEDKSLTLKVQWRKTAAGWVDAIAWPAFRPVGGSPGPYEIQSATSATNFIVRTTAGGYSGVTAPQVGNTFAIFDFARRRFSRKKILSVTGTGPWTIVCDTTNNASDTAYTPVTGDRPCPWSDSLDALVAPICAVFDRLGPGEQVATLLDIGRRQKRQPESPADWPNEITDRDLDAVFDLPEVHNVRFGDDPSGAPAVGVLGVSVNVFELSKLSVFPL